jgi:pyridoxamine 5'-phosphate oxidase family protein
VSFRDGEMAYLRPQRLAHLATVTRDGQRLYVGGRDPVNTRNFRNVRAGT